MDTNALTPDQKRGYLKALDAAIFRGVDYVSYGGEQIKFRSLSDLISIRDLLRSELGMSSSRPRIRSRRIIVRGFR